MRAVRLVCGNESRVLAFLNRRPLKNIIPVSSIGRYGLESPRHRGAFYGCFEEGGLIGVSLIGHCVMPEGGEECMAAFAEAAHRFHRDEVRQVLGEEVEVESFSRAFTQLSPGQVVLQRESYFQLALRRLTEGGETRTDLRAATADDQEEVTRVHAQAYQEMVGEELPPQDWPGFRQRVIERIEGGRVWIVRHNSGIGFKADVVSATDRAIYLEGIWTRPDLRSKGYGTQALRTLCQQLLQRHPAVCLCVRDDDPRALSFYQRIGFEAQGTYRLIRYGMTAS
ncbi:MAG TPA: GNAT family N-acetyltransferase [Blastocatellia bacterium]|nr:GNAT family N-acetyltransferase [Blastocatellia bacterium]